MATGASATPFALLSLRSATQFQYAAINANDLTLAIGAPTTTAPAPNNIGTTYPDTTSFILAPDGSLFMNAATTGEQFVYVSPQTGLVQITPAHTDYIPNGGFDNFTISGNPPELSIPGYTAYACGTGPYQIEFGVAALNTANCEEVGLLVSYLGSEEPTAWQYV